ncbi:MAG: ATP-binding protein [Burkholderiales bacterium]|nr:ATP-binding protein [Burkholderiales bacterium]
MSPIAWVHRRLKDRPDTEHEQALVRVALWLGLGVYLLVPHVMGERTDVALHTLLPFGAWVMLSLAIFGAILVHPGVSPVRRVIGAIGDSAAISYFMIQMGVDGLLLYVVYLWIIFGNGFRYGRFYLLNTLVLSVVGFLLVIILSDFWHAHVGAGISLIVGMIGISLYVLTLVNRLSHALDTIGAALVAERRFVATLSQEMRTPLSAIIGATELLRDTQRGGELSEIGRWLGASSRAMRELVDALGDLSKIAAGALTVAKKDFDLYALVNGASLVLRPLAEGKGLSFVVAIMPDVTPHVRGDPVHLGRVLINLLGNAVRFTDRGSVTLRVSRLGAEEGRERLRFAIHDTGIGIAPEHQRRISESFAQADQSVTDRFGGTGLRTTISKRLVELMGGRIGVESAAGQGTTFWFELEVETIGSGLGAAELAAR